MAHITQQLAGPQPGLRIAARRGVKSTLCVSGIRCSTASMIRESDERRKSWFASSRIALSGGERTAAA